MRIDRNTGTTHFKWARDSKLLVLIVLFFALILITPTAQRFEEATGLGWLFSIRGHRPAPNNVAIVAIHSQAAQAMDLPLPSRWPRTVYAELVDKLNQSGARVITLDIAFRNKTTDEQDLALAEAVNRAGNVVLFRYLSRYQVDAGEGMVDVEQAVGPPKPVAKEAAAIGSFTLPLDSNKVHRAQLFYERGGQYESAQPMLAFLLAHKSTTRELYTYMSGAHPTNGGFLDLQKISWFFYQAFLSHPRLEKELSHLRPIADDLDKSHVVYALAQTGPIFINYYGPHKTIHTIGIDEVMAASAEEAAALFADKVVFVGYSDDKQTEQRDSYTTVYSEGNGIDISGVEISATVLANLLDQSLIQPATKPIWFAAILTAAILALVTGWYLRVWQAALVQGATLAAYVVASVAAFTIHAYWLPLASPLVALLLGNALIFYAHFRFIRRRSQWIAQTLEQYVPRDVALELATSLAGLEKRHQVVQGVCMMSDIVGYSRLSENCEPDELHELMNRYYAVLIDEVKAQGGVVANIVGDSLLAVWAGPVVDSNLCAKACTTALNISRKLDGPDEFCAKLPTCFAVHGGAFSLGNLGALGHFEYSPVGDIINTTARMEKYNRTLGTRHLASDVIVRELSACINVVTQKLGTFALHNKSNTLPLWCFDYDDADLPAVNGQYQQDFQEALSAFEYNDIERARVLFRDLLERFPADGPSRFYLSQC